MTAYQKIIRSLWRAHAIFLAFPLHLLRWGKETGPEGTRRQATVSPGKSIKERVPVFLSVPWAWKFSKPNDGGNEVSQAAAEHLPLVGKQHCHVNRHAQRTPPRQHGPPKGIALAQTSPGLDPGYSTHAGVT